MDFLKIKPFLVDVKNSKFSKYLFVVVHLGDFPEVQIRVILSSRNSRTKGNNLIHKIIILELKIN